MLGKIDQALAGAIDVIADDVQATVKSVKEQGIARTLGDAVEDAAGLVAGGAGNAISTFLHGRSKGPASVSNHSGLDSGYANIVSGGGNSIAGGAAAFPYVPNASSGRPSASSSKAPVGNFAPGIGIRLPGQAPGPQASGFHPCPGAAPPPPPAIAPYAGPGAKSSAGAFRPPGANPAAAYSGYPQPAPAYQNLPTPAVPYTSPYSTPSTASSGTKEPPIDADVLARRFEVLVGKDVANTRCFDCGAADHEWASVSFGIFLCITCAGHHRQLGTHISRIRSCKMDSWTERTLSIFNSGGNKQLADFFSANGVPASAMFQRYSTPAADWYREAWIKNRTLGREVPAPVAGVVVGPCIDDKTPAAASPAKPAVPPAYLLDMGAESSAPATQASKPAAQADLLGFADEPAKPAQQADLLGVSPSTSGASDLLALGSSDTSSSGLLDFAPVTSGSPALAMASLDFNAAPITPSPVPASTAMPFPIAPVADTQTARSSLPMASNTLGGGAKLVVPAKDEKADDPFAMALKQWNM